MIRSSARTWCSGGGRPWGPGCAFFLGLWGFALVASTWGSPASRILQTLEVPKVASESSPPDTLEGSPAALPELVQEIWIRGLVELEAPLVRLMIQTQEGDPLDLSILEADLRELRKSAMFRSVAATIRPLTPGKVGILFELVEAPPYQGIRLEGVSWVDAAALSARCRKLAPKIPGPKEQLRIRDEIQRTYQAEGYFGIRVELDQGLEIDDQGWVRILVREPVLNQVQVQGDARVDEVILRRQFDLPRGEPIRKEKLEEAIARLVRLGTLRSARFAEGALHEPTSPGEHPRLDLILVVEEETYFGEIETGLRYERVNGFAVRLGLTRKALFGSGTSLSAHTETGSRESYGLEFQNANPFDLGVEAKLGFYRKEIRRELRNATTILHRLEDRRTGWGFSLAKDLGVHQLTLGYRDERIRATAEDGFPLPANLVAIGPSAGQAEYDEQALSLRWGYGVAGLPLELAEPLAYHAEVERAGLGFLEGPAGYHRVEVEGRKLWELDPRTQLAARLRFGAIFQDHGILPFLEKLTLGGSENLRGLLFKERTGDRQVLANLEWRRQLNSRLGGVLFADWGDAWDRRTRSLDPSLSLGLGLRINVQIFVLRLDLARELGGEEVRFAFGIGQLF